MRKKIGMKLDYNELPTEYYSTGKGQLYNHKGALCDAGWPHPEPPLLHQPPCLVYFPSEIDGTSQISWEERDSIIDNIQSALTGIDIGLNRQRAWANARAIFIYKTHEEIDNMNVE